RPELIPDSNRPGRRLRGGALGPEPLTGKPETAAPRASHLARLGVRATRRFLAAQAVRSFGWAGGSRPIRLFCASSRLFASAPRGVGATSDTGPAPPGGET